MHCVRNTVLFAVLYLSNLLNTLAVFLSYMDSNLMNHNQNNIKSHYQNKSLYFKIFY